MPATSADSLADAVDISEGGTVLTGSTDWGAPVTHEDNEPVISRPEPTDPESVTTWSLTCWHKFYMPAAGSITFSDDDTAAEAATDAYGYAGTVMVVYSGPPDATYDQLVLLTDPPTLHELSGPPYFSGASVRLDIADATWLYIQHAYAGMADQFGEQDDPAGVEQTMSWAPAAAPNIGTPDIVAGSTAVTIGAPTVYALAEGFTLVTAGGEIITPRGLGFPDEVDGGTSVEITTPYVIAGTPDPVTGVTTVAVTFEPDLSDNPPITMALELTGDLAIVPPEADTLPHDRNQRMTSLVVLTMPTPVIVNGKPTLPAHVATASFSGTLDQGPDHIRAIAPAPKWDGSGYVNPPIVAPPSTAHKWDGRWVVDDLPDPGSDWYWLGDPSRHDGTASIGVHKRRWEPHGTTPHAPSWRSFYPFKPSVREANHYLPGGNVVHHPKGVHFNPAFIEHMWLDWGGARRQPFTWVIAGMVASFPGRSYRHYILDAGRDPDSVHFPRLLDYQTSKDRKIHDNLPYRNLLAYSEHNLELCTRTNEQGPRTVRARAYGSIAPRMFYGVFNGSKSHVGHWSPNGQHQKAGRVDNGSNQLHRYYVLGRAQNHMSQDKAGHLLIFEIRFWRYAMSQDELHDQYAQLSSTYHFNKYRRL